MIFGKKRSLISHRKGDEMLAEVVATSFRIGGLIIFRAVSFSRKLFTKNSPLRRTFPQKSSAQHPLPVTSVRRINGLRQKVVLNSIPLVFLKNQFYFSLQLLNRR
jgi:hypothetical protein